MISCFAGMHVFFLSDFDLNFDFDFLCSLGGPLYISVEEKSHLDWEVKVIFKIGNDKHQKHKTFYYQI